MKWMNCPLLVFLFLCKCPIFIPTIFMSLMPCFALSVMLYISLIGFFVLNGSGLVMWGCLLWLISPGTRPHLMSQHSYTSPLENFQAAHHLNASPVSERAPSQINSKSYLYWRSIQITSILINALKVINTFYKSSVYDINFRVFCKQENSQRKFKTL